MVNNAQCASHTCLSWLISRDERTVGVLLASGTNEIDLTGRVFFKNSYESVRKVVPNLARRSSGFTHLIHLTNHLYTILRKKGTDRIVSNSVSVCERKITAQWCE